MDHSKSNRPRKEVAISAIYEACFSEVSLEYMNQLVKEIALWTGAQTVMIQRLLTLKEYMDIKNNEGCPSLQMVADSPDHPSREASPIIQDNSKHNRIEYMFIKACHSTLSSHTFVKNTVVPISLLSPHAPHIQTLRHSNYHVAQDASSYNSIFPNFDSFVGVRLDEKQLPIGLITVMHNKPMDRATIDLVQSILNAVKQRTKNEIERTRQRYHLIMVKNAALEDAQSKIKFLADMSHEIRTPMNAVIALTDLLLQERHTLNEEQAEHLEVIQTSGNHLLTVINDILDISKINNDPKFKLENRSFGLRKCVKDALNMARHQASMTQHNKLVYVAECPPEIDDNVPINQLVSQLEKIDPSITMQQNTTKTVLPLLYKIDSDVPNYLMGDTMRLTQILLNLCSNAVKFTKSGGIRVKISRYVPPGEPQKNNSDCKYMTFKERYDAKIESIYSRVMRRKKNVNDNPTSSAGASSSSANQPQYYYTDDTTAEEDNGATTEEEDTSEKVILEISVTDTGIGMPADRLPRLFKSFSQIDISTARRYGGTGLGLAISSMLVNRMGGGLWVESEEGRGSRFALTLPMTISLRKPAAMPLQSGYGGGGSESSSAYTSSGMIASPPSPGSSVSDGGSSVGDRTPLEPGNAFSPSSPSNSNGYFNGNHHRKYNNHSSSAWEPSTTISCSSAEQPLQNTMFNNNNYNSNNNSPHNTTTNINNNLGHTTSTSTSTSTTTTTTTATAAAAANINKGLQNLLSKSMDNSAQNPSSQQQQTSTTTAAASPKSKAESSLGSPRLPRVSLGKHHHHRKTNSNNHEENLALLYPIKIMLAEDNVLNQKIAISILKRLGYQDVIIAGNGREALDLMRVHKFDVIFMDLYMPEMDGLEATRYIISERKHNGPPPPPTAAIEEHYKGKTPPLLNVNDVYIIALTASASKQDRQICIDAGMNDFISKPFTMMEMKSALKNCASKRKKRKKQQLRDEELVKQQAIIMMKGQIALDYEDDDPMIGILRKNEQQQQEQEVDCDAEAEEEETGERETKSQSRINSSTGTVYDPNITTNATHPIVVDDPMSTSLDDLTATVIPHHHSKP